MKFKTPYVVVYGLPASGKSFLCLQLKKYLNIYMIPERRSYCSYANAAQLFSQGAHYTLVQEDILQLDIERSSELSRIEEEYRCIISASDWMYTLAYAYASSQCGLNEYLYGYVKKKYYEALISKKLHFPDMYIYLDLSYKDRLMNNSNDKLVKTRSNIFFDESFSKSMKEYFDTWTMNLDRINFNLIHIKNRICERELYDLVHQVKVSKRSAYNEDEIIGTYFKSMEHL